MFSAHGNPSGQPAVLSADGAGRRWSWIFAFYRCCWCRALWLSASRAHMPMREVARYRVTAGASPDSGWERDIVGLGCVHSRDPGSSDLPLVVRDTRCAGPPDLGSRNETKPRNLIRTRNGKRRSPFSTHTRTRSTWASCSRSAGVRGSLTLHHSTTDIPRPRVPAVCGGSGQSPADNPRRTRRRSSPLDRLSRRQPRIADGRRNCSEVGSSSNSFAGPVPFERQ